MCRFICTCFVLRYRIEWYADSWKLVMDNLAISTNRMAIDRRVRTNNWQAVDTTSRGYFITYRFLGTIRVDTRTKLRKLRTFLTKIRFRIRFSSRCRCRPIDRIWENGRANRDPCPTIAARYHWPSLASSIARPIKYSSVRTGKKRSRAKVAIPRRLYPSLRFNRYTRTRHFDHDGEKAKERKKKEARASKDDPSSPSPPPLPSLPSRKYFLINVTKTSRARQR